MLTKRILGWGAIQARELCFARSTPISSIFNAALKESVRSRPAPICMNLCASSWFSQSKSIISQFPSISFLQRRTLAVTAQTVEPPKASTFAVVVVGGKQYKVCENDVIVTEQLVGKKVGDKVKVDDVLLVGTASETKLGQPKVAGASVEVVVEQQTLAEKVYTFKMRRRKNSRRLRAFRASVSSLRVISIKH